jgi:hypothetical protein
LSFFSGCEDRASFAIGEGILELGNGFGEDVVLDVEGLGREAYGHGLEGGVFGGGEGHVGVELVEGLGREEERKRRERRTMALFLIAW